MLTINISGGDFFNEQTEEYVTVKPCVLQLEHSLISISKWEAAWKKSFLASDKTDLELRDYIRCMAINQNVDPLVFVTMDDDSIETIKAYIADDMTATTFTDDALNKELKVQNKPVKKKKITSEQIYSWMINLGIPSEYQKWHLNRLLTLIRILNIENEPKKKNQKPDLAKRAALNAARRKQLNTKG